MATGYYDERLDPILQDLGSHSSHLTHLTFGYVREATVRMADILSSCPHLQSFEVESAHFDLTHLPQGTFPSLKTLRIGAAYQHIPHDDMVTLLKLLPSLEYFGINPWQTTKTLTAIQEYCRSLKFLQCGPQPMNKDWKQLPMDSQHGLQCIQIQGLRNEIHDPCDIDLLLECHHNTLQVIELSFLCSQSIDLNLLFPRLRRLVIKSGSMDESCFYGWWILKNAPNIKELEFDTIVSENCHGLIQGLQHFTSLGSLKLYADTGYLLPTSHSLLHDFLKHQTQLQSLEAHVKSYMLADRSWSTSICSMSRLQYLDLYIVDDTYPSSATFVKYLLRHCPLLETLHLRCRRGITDHILLFIRWKYLNELTIPIVNLSRTGIMSLINCVCLKNLNIIQSADDDEKAVKMLMKARPDMQINSSDFYRH